MSAVILPDWMPKEAWDGYVAMRKKQRKPMTDRAEQMAIAKLLELREQGQDIEKVLEQSEFNCWQGLFAIRAEPVKATAPAQLRVVPTPNWWCSDGGIIAKGRELKMDPRPGESYGAFKDRIFAKLDDVNTRRGSA